MAELVGIDLEASAEHPLAGGSQLGLTFDPAFPEAPPVPTLVTQRALAAADAPHLAWPLRMTTKGSLSVIAQDSLADVRQCVHVLLKTPLGWRPLAPDVGVPDPTFTQGIDAASLAARLMNASSGEPRAAVTVDAPPPSPAGAQAVRIQVRLADQGNAGADPDLEEGI